MPPISDTLERVLVEVEALQAIYGDDAKADGAAVDELRTFCDGEGKLLDVQEEQDDH